MERQQEIPQASVDYVYEIAARGRASEIDRALSEFPAALRLRDPGAMALRAAKHVLAGDVPAAIALLQRALTLGEFPDTAYLTDLLAGFLYSAGQFDAALAALDAVPEPPDDLLPLFRSARAVICASRGLDDDSRRYRKTALAAGRALDSPTMAARVLQRVAIAAFYCEDYDEAQDRAVEAARAFTVLEAHRQVALTYSILYAIANFAEDGDLARFYAEKMAVSARNAGDQASLQYALSAQLLLAAESGDEKRLGSLRARLLANQLNQQYRERFPHVLADALMHGWAGRFEVVRPTIIGLRKNEQLPQGQRAQCEALLAVAAVASWNLEKVRDHAHQAIRLAAEPAGTEGPHERRAFAVARIIAAVACIMSGEPSVGRRALTRSCDPDGRFARILSETGIDEQEAPLLMRGYARYVNAAYRASLRARPSVGLTAAEIEVLRRLPSGETLEAIAASLGKSRKTVERQVTSIYAKLDVANRAQAVSRIRELELSC